MINPLIAITRKHAIIFSAYLVFYEFLVYIANDMIMPGMLSVVHGFHADESRIATSLTAYILGGASLQLLLGPLSDQFGRRPVMLFGSALFSAFTLLLPWAQTINQFLIGRFFEGMGLCYIHAVGYALLQEIFSDADAIRLIAIMANVAMLAPLLGPLAGSVFLQYATWHSIFYLIGGLSLAALWGLWHYMPESVGQIKNDGKMIQSTKISLFSILENYKVLVQHPKFVSGTLACALMGIPAIVWIALSPVILVSKAHMSLVMYGVWQIPVFGAFILANILLSLLSHRYSIIRLSFLGSIILFLGLAIMCLFPYYYGAEPFGLMPGLVIYSLGYGMAATPLYRFLLFSTQIGTGTTSALISTITMCSFAAGAELGNYLYSVNGNLSIANYAGWIAVVYIVFASISLFPHTRDKHLGVENL